MERYFKPKPKPAFSDPKSARKKIAEQTLEALNRGSYVLHGVTHNLRARSERSQRNTKYYSPESLLSIWNSNKPLESLTPQISLLEISTLDGARFLHQAASSSAHAGKIGVLNFASAKKPGGGFQSGAQAQEESIARSSTLYPTLMTDTSQQFYTLHNKEPRHGYYSHAMIYSPGVVVFRDDDGKWIEPYEIDVLTSPAVNAGVVRESLSRRHTKATLEEAIEKEMRERMARILFLFEKAGAMNLVLGSFGTGVFKNDVDTVAKIWADLLSNRFKHSFSQIVFAILGNSTFVEFLAAFNERRKEN